MKSFNGGFKNFWHYNKWKILALIFLVAFVVFAITQCNMKSEPKFSILCATGSPVSGGEVLKQKLSQNVDFSKTDDGEMELSFEHIQISDSKSDRVMLGTSEELYNHMINGDYTLLLFDKESVLYFSDEDGVFVDLSGYAKKYNVSEDNLIRSADGKTVCAISLVANKFMSSCSMDCSDLYIALRVPRDGDVEKYTNAKASLEYILSNR